MNKQIEEMEALVCRNCACRREEIADCHLSGVFCDKCKRTAEAIYNAGYRKASEVAREIFAEIDALHIHTSSAYVWKRYAELKKKYESEGADDV